MEYLFEKLTGLRVFLALDDNEIYCYVGRGDHLNYCYKR